MGYTIRNCRATSLVEIMIAVALAAGPMLVAIELVRSNSQAARFNHDRATARMLLLDLVTLLEGESLAGLKQYMTGDRLSDLLSKRIVLMPESAREPYFEQAHNILGRIRGRLDEDVDPQRPGLARLSLTAGLSSGVTVQVISLFRPRASERLRVDVDSSCTAGGGEAGDG